MRCGVVKSIGMLRKLGWAVTIYRMQPSHILGVRMLRTLRMQIWRRLRQDARLTHVMQRKFLQMSPTSSAICCMTGGRCLSNKAMKTQWSTLLSRIGTNGPQRSYQKHLHTIKPTLLAFALGFMQSASHFSSGVRKNPYLRRVGWFSNGALIAIQNTLEILNSPIPPSKCPEVIK